MRFRFSGYSRLAVLLLASILSVSVFSAPYNGDIVELEQPDGTMIQVRFFGDEYYCRGESLDGYTVIRDPMSGWVVYADINEDATEFVPTDVAYDHRVKTDPDAPEFGRRVGVQALEDDHQVQRLQKGLRLRRDVVAAKHLQRRMELQEQSLPSPETGVTDMAVSEAAAPEIAPAPLTGSVVGLTLLVEFQDVHGTIPASEIDRFCNEIGYTGYNNKGSVREFFLDVSGGLLDYTNIVTDYIRLDREKSYYDACGSWGKASEVIDEALAKLCASGFDFSSLSMRGDRVMAFNVLYAGTPSCGWSEGLWPHASSHTVTVCGKTFGSYQMTDIGNSLGLGTFCHENGHMVCRYPDLYDYYDDDSDGVSETNGVGNYCLMAYGGADTNPVPPCSYLRGKTGWETFIPVNDMGGGAVLWHTANSNTTYKYVNPADSREYFLIESRLKTGRNASLPDEGLLVWRIRENGSNPYPTNHPTHPYRKGFEVAVEQADNQFHLERRIGYGGSGDLFHQGDKTEFSDFTAPDAKWWDDSFSGLAISDISAVAGEMSFRLGAGSEPTTHYALDGNGTDSSANGYHATGFNFVNPWSPTSFTGSYDNLGSCLIFDGVDDYVECPAAVGDSAEWTCALWIRADKLADMGAVDKFPTGSGGAGWSVRLSKTGRVAFVIGSQSNNSTLTTPAPVYEPGRWVHVACTYADGTAKIFINGTMRMIKKGITQTPQTSVLNAVIGTGAQLFTDFYFQGQMDEVRFYDVALNAGSLSMLAGLNFKPDRGPLAILPLDEKAGTLAVDAGGRGCDGTLKNGLSFDTGSTDGPVGQALTFDGVNDYIALNPAMDKRNDGFTVALWACPQAVQSWARFIDFGNGEGSDNILLARRENSNDLVFRVYSGTSGGAEVRAANAIELNKWQFFAAAVDSAGSVRIYKNGQLIQSGTTAAPKVIRRSNLYIGKSNWPDAYYQGAMDDIRIYNYALAGTQIDALYKGNRMDGPVPFSGADDVSPETVLTFTPAANAVRHDIYFGTEYGAVQSADTTSPEYRGRKTNRSYNPALLDAWREYFWRVDEILADGTIQTGPVWRFSTVGSIQHQVWTDLPDGVSLSGLTQSPDYPDNPSSVALLDSFEAPINWDDNYGTRMRGLLVPRTSGNYRFWIASDDYSVLYLNQNGEDPAGAVQIASVNGATAPRDWFRYASQRSGLFALTAGKPYYIMALHKEGGGDDNLAVAWEGPDCPVRDIIDAFYLRPPRENEPPVFSVPVVPELSAVEGQVFSAGLSVAATDPEGQGVTYRRQTGPDWLQVAPNGQLSGTPRNADVGLNTFTIRALDGKGGFDDAVLSIDVADRLTGTMGLSDLLGFAHEWLNADMDSPAGLDQAVPVDLEDFAILSDNWNADVIDGLAAHWAFDETVGLTARDNYAAHDAALVNMGEHSWVDGVLDNALAFDGLSTYAEVAQFNGISGGASRTCSAWIRTDGAAVNMVIVNWGTNDPGRQWLLGVFASGQLGVYTNGASIKTDATVTDGRWHHVAAVLHDDGSATLDEVKLYIDGMPQAAAFSSTQSMDTSADTNVYVGAFEAAPGTMAAYFSGRMDDIRIYDRALTDDEIRRTASAGMQLSLSFDDSAGTVAADDSVYHRDAVFDTAPAWQPLENVKGAVSLAGDNFAVVEGCKGIIGGASRTCAAWIKTNGSSSNMIIMDWGGLTSGQQWLFGIFSTGELVLYAGGPYIKTNARVTDGQWHHVAAVLTDDGSPTVDEIKLYVDGIPQSTTYTSAAAINTAEGQDVSIGAYQLSSGQFAYFYEGMLDEIKVYDKALSEAQVSELANP